MRYYISDENHPMGFVEASEAEYTAIFGDETIRPYASKVYYGELSIDEVPVELRASVQATVNEKIKRWGEYTYTEITGGTV